MWIRIDSAEDWDDALRSFPHPHVLQCWAWGELKARWGWAAERWRLDDDGGSPRAMVQILRRRIGPASVYYAPKGPVARDVAGYERALEHVERRARKALALWAKVDGDLIAWQPGGATAPPGHDGSDARDGLRTALARRGWRYSDRQVQFRNTMLTDLRRPDAELLAAMKEKWRYNVRLSARRGVKVREASAADYPRLYAMYEETGQRDGFVIREERYYTDVWRNLPSRAFIAEFEGRPVAGLVLLCFADRAWYFYGMSTAEAREHMPTYALQWHAMRWARDAGFATYDWWGAPDKLEESDPMWGVYRWKQGFGADLVEGIGAWDYALIPAAARIAGRLL